LTPANIQLFFQHASLKASPIKPVLAAFFAQATASAPYLPEDITPKGLPAAQARGKCILQIAILNFLSVKTEWATGWNPATCEYPLAQ
jgi:hypothetical protein